MAKFLFVYHGGTKPASPQDAKAGMAKWDAWLDQISGQTVDPGHPVGKSSTVTSDGVANNGGSNPASGYGVFTAANLDEALDMAKGCPILEAGGSVEVAEAMGM